MTSKNITVSCQKTLGGQHCNIYDVTVKCYRALRFTQSVSFLGYMTNHYMTCLEGNSSFCFPRILVLADAEGLLSIPLASNCKL